MTISFRFALLPRWIYWFSFSVLIFSNGAAFGVQDFDFFESRIRPVLIERCYSCHNSTDNAEGGLALDFRDGIRSESGNGTAVVPGDTAESLLLKVIRHELDGLEMPAEGPELSAEVVADFEKWIADGAPDPRETAPTKTELTQVTSWETTLAKRKLWWCFQPLRKTKLPHENEWSNLPIDRFVYEVLDENEFRPAETADKPTLARRLSYALRGLPPTKVEVDEFLNDPSSDSYEALVDRMLASPQFGERWARHWMDLVRYADSHGSEGDPLIPNAYQYRDYLIRAFNNDVPYDQLLREHIAGDLLESPRINHQLGINESAIGPAHLRLVFHGFAPTDALDEKVRFTDDQINVMTKAFQGLTVSCARCHDHKFDAISQADYFALFGVLGSCRPAMNDVNLKATQDQSKRRLAELKIELRSLIADDWLARLDRIPNQLHRFANETDLQTENGKSERGLLTAYRLIEKSIKKNVKEREVFWQSLASKGQTLPKEQSPELRRWKMAIPADVAKWFSHGNGLSGAPVSAGEFSLASDGKEIVEAVYPGCVITHQFSNRHRGVFSSPQFNLDKDYEVWLHLTGSGKSTVRYVVQNYPRDGTVYPIHEINQADWVWQKLDLSYWQGDDVHLEFATAKDAPVQVRNQDRSWFGVRDVVVQRKNQPPPERNDDEMLKLVYRKLYEAQPETMEGVAACYQDALRQIIEQWKVGKSTDHGALLINASLKEGLLRNSLEELPGAQALVEEYRRLESAIPLPTRVPGVTEADAFDQPLFERGNHLRPLEPVRRRYLEAIDARPFETTQSGRLQLAAAMLDANNPLTSRVIANRIWHYLFGRGIVATPDNFGLLGETPSHPELLDYLSFSLEKNGWSMKHAIREIVLSKTWQQSSVASELARKSDPLNRFFSHANVRRLDAESIRDSLLLVSGELDLLMFGPGATSNSNSRRRSVYLQSRRNSLDSFLQVFDSPIPFSTTGRRNETNVPAQSLTLLNDPFVVALAKSLARNMIDRKFENDRDRVVFLFDSILGRMPSEAELTELNDFLKASKADIVRSNDRRKLLSRDLEKTEIAIRDMLDPVRKKLLGEKVRLGIPAGPIPYLGWDFTSQSTKEELRLHGDAEFTESGLQLKGNGFASTSPIDKAIDEKTLEVRVRLSNLEQRGGGAITIQDLPGVQFDSVVFGEQSPKHWMAGSNGFARTESFNGVAESEAVGSAVHFAIVYDRDGTIKAYRNGVPFGNPIRKSGLVTYAANRSQLVFGLRHGTDVSGGRMLVGTIVGARLYDRALTAEEVELASRGGAFVSHREILAALSREQRSRLDELHSRVGEVKIEIADLGEPTFEVDAPTRLVHALFNLKEFLYIQ